MNKVYVDENIYYIEDFMSASDIEIFLQSLKYEELYITSPGSGPHSTYMFLHESNINKFWKNKYVKRIKDYIVDEGDFYKNENDSLWITKYKEYFAFSEEEPKGDDASWIFPPHSDAYDSDINRDLTKGWVIYLTDKYDGGELVYVNKDISIKPRAGTIIVHPGTDEYIHGVKKFSGGERIIIAGFNHKKQ